MKVRVNSRYIFSPAGFDRFNPIHFGLKEGDTVKVIHKHGCPPANTMGQCYVERDGVWMGMVATASLVSVHAYLALDKTKPIDIREVK